MKYFVKKLAAVVLALSAMSSVQAGVKETPNYTNNRYPLVQKPYMELPLGSIRPTGWLREMLERQRTGATSKMDELYPEVMGPRNGWLGGDGDQWERGPYWIDGLLPLAYILDDEALKKKCSRGLNGLLRVNAKTAILARLRITPMSPVCNAIIRPTGGRVW